MASPGFRPSPRSATASTTPSKVVTQRPSPSTPIATSIPATPPMSRWLHPRMNEINRRKNASTFGERNIQTIVWSGAFLVLSVVASPAVYRLETMLPVVFTTFVQFLLEESADAEPPLATPAVPDGSTIDGISLLGWVLIAFRVYLVGLIVHALRPLVFAPDDFSDIPLTPTQRSLLNLAPLPASKASTPASTPGSGILTPPRLPRSPATSTRSRSLSASFEPSTTRAVAGSSPVGFSTPPRHSPAQRSASGSPLGVNIRDRSPLADSRGLGRSNSVGAGYSPSLRGSGKRWSMGGAGSPGALGESSMSSLSVGPGSPTPLPRTSTPNMGGVGLNNKWLYERFRSSGMGERRPYSSTDAASRASSSPD